MKARTTADQMLAQVMEDLRISADAPAQPMQAVDADAAAAAMGPASPRKRERDRFCYVNVKALDERPQKASRSPPPRRHPLWAARSRRYCAPIDTSPLPREGRASVVGA